MIFLLSGQVRAWQKSVRLRVNGIMYVAEPVSEAGSARPGLRFRSTYVRGISSKGGEKYYMSAWRLPISGRSGIFRVALAPALLWLGLVAVSGFAGIAGAEEPEIDLGDPIDPYADMDLQPIDPYTDLDQPIDPYPTEQTPPPLTGKTTGQTTGQTTGNTTGKTTGKRTGKTTGRTTGQKDFEPPPEKGPGEVTLKKVEPGTGARQPVEQSDGKALHSLDKMLKNNLAQPKENALPGAGARTTSGRTNTGNSGAAPHGQAGAGFRDGSGTAPLEQAAAGFGPNSGTGAMDLSRPRSTQELVLAASGGYGNTFKALGLKIGRGPGGPAIVRKDGEPASAAEVDQLRLTIAGEPAALMKRPDFFNVIKRDRYEQLKARYANMAKQRADSFKDIALTRQNRDFAWSASCDLVSGGCNRYAERSYRKSDFVEPESLGNIWRGQTVSMKYRSQDLSTSDNSLGSGKWGDFKSLFSGISDFFGGGNAVAGGPSFSPAGDYAEPGRAGKYTARAGPLKEPGTKRAGGSNKSGPPVPLSGRAEPVSHRRLILMALAACALVMVSVLVARRRKTEY